ncbi:hypothetical protein U1Q18_009903 [Sarracenia purpurea var. burkii]
MWLHSEGVAAHGVCLSPDFEVGTGDVKSICEFEKNAKQGINEAPLLQKVFGEMPLSFSEARVASLPHQISEPSQFCSEGKSWANIVARDASPKEKPGISRLNIRSSSSNIEMVDLGTAEKSEDERLSPDTVLGWEKVTKQRTIPKAYDKNSVGDKSRKKVGSGQFNKCQLNASSESKAKIENKAKVGTSKAVTLHRDVGTKVEGNMASKLRENRDLFRVGAFGSKVEQVYAKVCRPYGVIGDPSPQVFPPLSNLAPAKGGAEQSKMKEGCG